MDHFECAQRSIYSLVKERKWHSTLNDALKVVCDNDQTVALFIESCNSNDGSNNISGVDIPQNGHAMVGFFGATNDADCTFDLYIGGKPFSSHTLKAGDFCYANQRATVSSPCWCYSIVNLVGPPPFIVFAVFESNLHKIVAVRSFFNEW